MPRTERVSKDSLGVQANAESRPAIVSASGLDVVFESWASNLDAGPDNQVRDVFLHSTSTGVTKLVSASLSGSPGNGISAGPDITPNGEFIVFASGASDLVVGDTNGTFDVFLWRRSTASTERLSLSSYGHELAGDSAQPSITPDAAFMAFTSNDTSLAAGDINGVNDIFWRDNVTGAVALVSTNSSGVIADGFSELPAISADGRLVAFRTKAGNLVPGDTNFQNDIYVRDMLTGVTTRASVDSQGIGGNEASDDPTISDDGRFVAFSSIASNLVPGDTNGSRDVFVHDRQTGVTRRVSVSSLGQQADNGAWWPRISPDGGYVVFGSDSNNLLDGLPSPGGWECYLHELASGSTTLVSVDSGGNPSDNISVRPSVSAYGRVVTFNSRASNLVPEPTNTSYLHNYVHRTTGCPFPEVSCQASTTSLPGCDLGLSFVHAPTLSDPSVFEVSAQGPGGNLAIAFFGISGAASLPLGTQGGMLCVQPPLWRSAVQAGSGSAGSCSDHYRFDLSDLQAGSPAIVAGNEVHLQVWARDLVSSDGFAVSNALRFTVCP